MEQKKLKDAMENLKHEMCMVFPCENQCDICAIGTAIKSIEKQIQMKPIPNRDNTWVTAKCPSCGKPLKTGKGSSSRYRNDWCNHCGQAINWNSNEDNKDD